MDTTRETDLAVNSPLASKPIRILLVDDSSVERLAMGHYLRRAGFAVDEADDGKSALAYLQNREFDILLLDLQMPGLNGFDVLGYLQQHRRGLPVILMSGMPVDQIEHKMLNLPKHELPTLFLKPIDLDQLVEMVHLRLSGDLPDLSANEPS
jgi:DNA-binding response OmpR family regulator